MDNNYSNMLYTLAIPTIDDVIEANFDISNIYRKFFDIIESAYNDSTVNKDNFSKLLDDFLFRITSLEYTNLKHYFVMDRIIIYLGENFGDKLPESFLFKSLFYFSNNEYFTIFFSKHSSRLKDYVVRNKFTVLLNNESTDVINIPNMDVGAYLFYDAFKDDLNLEDKEWQLFFSFFNDEEMLKLLNSSLDESCPHRELIINSDTALSFISKNFLKYFDLYVNLLKLGMTIRVCEFSLIEEDVVRNSKAIDSPSFFSKLNYLSQLSEWEHHEYYQECYNLFLNIMKARIPNLEDKHYKLIENIFNGIISGVPFIIATSINNLNDLQCFAKSLRLFCTPAPYFLGSFNEITARDIATNITQNCSDNCSILNAEILNYYSNKNIPCFKVIYVLGEDFIKNIVCGLDFNIFYNFIEFCLRHLALFYNDDYKKKLIPFMLNFSQENKENNKEANNFSLYLLVFTLLYQSNYPVLSFSHIKCIINKNPFLEDSMGQLHMYIGREDHEKDFNQLLDYLATIPFVAIQPFFLSDQGLTIEHMQLELFVRGLLFNNPDMIYNTSYYKKLDELRALSQDERMKHKYFNECYWHFDKIMHNRIKDLTEEDDIILNQLFNRIIDGESFLLITSFYSRSSLLFYYHTKLFVNNLNLPDDVIANINKVDSSQYIDFFNRFEKILLKKMPNIFGELVGTNLNTSDIFSIERKKLDQRTKCDIIKLISLLGYDKLVALINDIELNFHPALILTAINHIASYLTQIEPEHTFQELLNFLKINPTSTVKPSFLNHSGIEKDHIYSELLIRGFILKNPDMDFKTLYFSKINFLRELPKGKRIVHQYYHECYSIFRNIMYDRIKELSDNDEKMIDDLFNRIIRGASFLLITSITSKASLLFYYRTNLFINGLSDSLINGFSKIPPKQWISCFTKIGELIKKDNNKQIFLDDRLLLSQEYILMIVNLVISFGYDCFFKIINLAVKRAYPIKELLYIFYISENKDSSFGPFILEFLTNVDYSYKSINKYIAVYNYLYKGKHPKINIKIVEDALKSYEFLLFPNNKHIIPYLNKLNFVRKGDVSEAKIKGILLFDRYSKRRFSSIPNLIGYYENLEYGTVPLKSPEIISNGIDNYLQSNGEVTPSCLAPSEKAESSWEHGAINPNGRFFYIKHNGKLLAYTWMWRNGDVLCFDNVELTTEYNEIPNKEFVVYQIYMNAAREFVKMSEESEKNPIKLVIMGRNPKYDIKISFLDNLPSVSSYYSSLFKPLDSEKLYLKDSSEKQVILFGGGNHVSLSEVKPIYLSERKPVVALDNDMTPVNAIYWDFCKETCTEYRDLYRTEFKSGFIGEDWFWGEKTDGSTMLIERFDDHDRRKQEIALYTKSIGSPEFKHKINIIMPPKDRIEFLLNPNNYYYTDDTKKQIDSCWASLEQPFSMPNDCFFHGTNLPSFASILEDRMIASHEARNSPYPGCGITNGRYFVCVAKYNSSVYQAYRQNPGFFLSELLTFSTSPEFLKALESPYLQLFGYDSQYPIRISGNAGEYQVYGHIPIEKAIAISLPRDGLSMAQCIYLAEEFGYNLPFVDNKTEKVVNPHEIMRLVKLR